MTQSESQPLSYAHPQATHTVQLGQVRVAYLLVRSRRKSISLEIAERGLMVRAPWHASLGSLESVLHSKAAWVLSKLGEREIRQQQKPGVTWQHGAWMPYRGGQLQLLMYPAAPKGGELLALGPQQWALHLALPMDASAASVRAALQAWWLRHARDVFTQRLQHFAPVLGVQWRSLRLSNARTRWGSAKADGSIMLNWRLLHFAQPVVDYVVVHELSHLREMNHSPRFWAVVAQACPDYARLRGLLRTEPVPDWGLPAASDAALENG